MKKSYVLLHISVILAGFTGVFGKLILLNAVLLVWYRLLFSIIIFYIIIFLFKIKIISDTKTRFSIALSGLVITTHWLLFYASIKYSNISVGVVCYCLTSCFTAILKPIVNKKRFNLSEIVFSIFTLTGISLIFHFDATFRTGIILGIFSSLFGTIYTLVNEQLVKRYDGISINYNQMIGGFLALTLLLPIYQNTDPAQNFIPSSSDVISLILLSLFCTVGLYTLVTLVLKNIPAFTLNLTFNLEPIYAIVIAFLFFDEGKQVGVSFYIGIFFVIISVALQTIFTINKNKIIN